MSASEQHLLRQWIERRDPDAFAEIVRRHATMVYSTCCRVLGNASDAEDIAQECFLKLAQERRPIQSPGGWLHRLATHRSIDRIRSVSRRTKREQQFAEDHPESVEPAWDDIREMVDEAIAALPEKFQGPLVAHYFEGRTYDAIAVELGIPRATAAGRVRRGVEKIRKTLQKRGVPISAVGLAAALAQAPAEALPASLSAALVKIAVAGTAGGAGAGTVVAAGTGAMTLGKIAAGVLVAAIALTGIVVWSGSKPEPSPAQSSRVEQVARAQEPSPSSGNDEGLAAMLVNAFNANSSPTAGRTAVMGEGAVTGIVVDESGEPVEGASVSARSTPMSHEQVTSDADGQFAIEGLETSNHLYVQAALRRTGRTRESREQYSQISAPAGPLTLTREGIRDLELVLHTSGSIQGQLVDEAGKPVPEINVSASPKSCDLNHPSWSRTDANGQFTIRDCAEFTYLILAFPPGTDMISHDTALAEITLEPGEQRTGLKLTYQPYVDLKGRVVDAAGNPVAGARVHEVYQGQMAETGSDGVFELTVFAGKGTSPTLGVQHADYDHIRHLVPEGGLENIEIVLLPRLTLAGRVIDAQTQEPIREFEIMHLGGRVSALEFTRFFDRLEPVRDASGRFSMKMESPEYATIGVRADGYAPLVQGVDLLSHTGELILELSPGNHLEGTVRNANGDRVRGAKIYIGQFPYGYELADDEKVLVAKTNWMGSFSLDDAPAGEHLIYAWHPDYPPAWQRFNAPQSEPIDIVFSQGGTLKGTVTIGGQPAQSIINLFRGVPDMVGFDERSRPDGTYEMANLSPGVITVSVGVSSPDTGERMSFDKPATIRDGEVTVVDFDFPTPGAASVEGQIQIDGQPVTGGYISAALPGGSTKDTRVDAEGYYRLEQLPQGAIMLDIRASLGEGSCQRRDEVLVEGTGDVVHDVALQSGHALSVAVHGARPNEQVLVKIYAGALNAAPQPAYPVDRAFWPIGFARFDGVTYTFDSVEPGTYTVVAEATSGAPTSQDERLANTRAAIQVINMDAVDTEIELALR
ncbi:MAG: hypothetical protein AMXMBFR82_23000 [Candidatus Hydrogenedentota bacterium]